MQELLEEYLPRVYRFALRLTGSAHDAEDLTQETFLRAWKHRRTLKHQQAARVWLFRIAANLWKDELRKGKTRAASRQFTVADDPAGSDPVNPVEAREELEIALAALDSLPDRQRDVLYLSAVEDLSAAEVADVLEINVAAVRTNLSLARRKMRERLRLAADFPSQSDCNPLNR